MLVYNEQVVRPHWYPQARTDDEWFLFVCAFAAVILLGMRARTLAVLCALLGLSFLVLSSTDEKTRAKPEGFTMDNSYQEGSEPMEQEEEYDEEAYATEAEEEEDIVEEEYATEEPQAGSEGGEVEPEEVEEKNEHTEPLQSELIFAPCPDCDDDQILFYGDYTSGPAYAQHRAQLVRQQHWRCLLEGQLDADTGKKPLDRMARVWPRVSIYRDTTGQTSRFNYLS